MLSQGSDLKVLWLKEKDIPILLMRRFEEVVLYEVRVLLNVVSLSGLYFLKLDFV